MITPDMKALRNRMWKHAQSGLWDGKMSTTPSRYFTYARQEHVSTGTTIIFTREYGYHTGGWFKNPDYERCWHLSIGFWDMLIRKPRPFEPALARDWARLFFGDWTRYIWEEGPAYKPSADHPEVHHYRVFCDARWQPIIPRGEVYNRDFIEKDWQSWSEQQGNRLESEEGKR